MVASSHTSNSEDRECPICNELYGEHERAKELVCGHIFGSRCIRRWLRNHDTCPNCRTNVVRDVLHPVFSGSHASVEWTTRPVYEVTNRSSTPQLEVSSTSTRRDSTVQLQNVAAPSRPTRRDTSRRSAEASSSRHPIVGASGSTRHESNLPPEAFIDQTTASQPLPSHISASELRELLQTELWYWSIWALRRLRRRIFQEREQRSQIRPEDLDRLYRRVRRAAYDSWEDEAPSHNGHRSISRAEENISRRPKPLRAMIPVIVENYSPPPSPHSPTRNSHPRDIQRDRSIKYPKDDLEGRRPVIETRMSRSSSTRHQEPEIGTSRHHDRSQVNRSNTVHSSRHRQHEHTDTSRSSRARQPPVRSTTLYPPRRPSRTAATVREEEGERSLRAHDASGRHTSRSSRAQPHVRSSTVRDSRVEGWLQGQAVPEEDSPNTEN
ncbi:MAG: hypothetical protein Q9191_000763 [Dirinaria sp. TL-2023a]